MIKEVFGTNGELLVPVYKWYRLAYQGMEENHKAGKMKEAKEFEDEIAYIINFVKHPQVKEDIQFEMHNSRYTQGNWPFRKRTGLNAQALLEEDDYE